MTEETDTILSLNKVSRIYPKDIANTPMSMLSEMLLPHSLRKYLGIDDFFALKDINLELKKGQKLGIIGAHRSGKSSLAGIASGLLSPSTGEIIANGSRLLFNRPTAGFKPTLTVYENLIFRASLAGLHGQELTEIINTTLSRCGIPLSGARTPIGNLSPYLTKQLGMTLLLEIPADILIIDELSGAGYGNDRRETRGYLQNKIENCSALVISTDSDFLNETTEQSLILYNSQTYGPFTTQTAIEYFNQLPEESGHQLDESNPLIFPIYCDKNKYIEDEKIHPIAPKIKTMEDNNFKTTDKKYIKLQNQPIFNVYNPSIEKSQIKTLVKDIPKKNLEATDKKYIKSQNQPIFTVSSIYVDDNKYAHSEFHLLKKQGDFTKVEINLTANIDINVFGGDIELTDGNSGITFSSSSIKQSISNISKGGKLTFTFIFEIPKYPGNFFELSFTPIDEKMKPNRASRIKILIYGTGYMEKQITNEIKLTTQNILIS